MHKNEHELRIILIDGYVCINIGSWKACDVLYWEIFMPVNRRSNLGILVWCSWHMIGCSLIALSLE